MPKDKNLAKHKSRFDVRGGVINEFDFQRSHGALTEEEKDRFARQEEERTLREGEAEQSPQSEAERIYLLMTQAHEKAEKNLSMKERKSGYAAQRPARKRSGGAKKSRRPAAKAAARKARAKKGSAKKASGKKAASKAKSSKRATKKGGARKAGKKSAARKSGARRR